MATQRGLPLEDLRGGVAELQTFVGTGPGAVGLRNGGHAAQVWG